MRFLRLFLFAGCFLCIGLADVAAQNIRLTFVNNTKNVVQIYFLPPGEPRESYGEVKPGAIVVQRTFFGHQWQLVGSDGATLFHTAVRSSRVVFNKVRKAPGQPPVRVELKIVNRSGQTVNIFWINENGKEQKLGSLENGGSGDTRGLTGSVFLARDSRTNWELKRVTLGRAAARMEIGKGKANPVQPPVQVKLTVVNRSRQTIKLSWIDENGKERNLGSLEGGGSAGTQAHAGMVFIARDARTNRELDRVTLARVDATMEIGKATTNPVPVVVPQLIGLSRAAAERALQAAGLKSNAMAEKESTTQGGKVHKQSPRSGSKVAKGTVVAYSYFRSRAIPTVQIPSLINQSREAAERALRNLGLKPKSVVGLETGNAASVGRVYAQSPRAGTGARRGAEVTLRFYKARPAPVRVTVPNVVGLSQTVAAGRINGKGGLTARAVEGNVTANASLVGQVYSQNPRGGSKVAPNTQVTLHYYKAKPGPKPVDASVSDPVPNIAAHANARGEIEVAWVGDDGKIHVSSYSGRNWSRARHIVANGTLSLLGGFTRDEKGNRYLLTMREEQTFVTGDRADRPNVVKLLKRDAQGSNFKPLVDLNNKRFVAQWPITNPLITGNDRIRPRHTSRLAYGNGQLAMAFDQNRGIHQSSSLIALTTTGQPLYNEDGSQHSANVRLIYDGSHFVMGQTFEGGIGLSKLTKRGEKLKWSDHILVFKNTWKGKLFGDGFIRLGGISPTRDGYLVTFSFTRGYMWTYGKNEWSAGAEWKPGTREPDWVNGRVEVENATLYVVKVPKNFHTLPKFKWIQVKPTWLPPDTPRRFTTTVLDRPGGKRNNVRSQIVGLKNGRHLVIWEQWETRQFSKRFLKTLAAVVDGNGRRVGGIKDLGSARIQRCADAFYLANLDKAAWISGDAQNRRLVLYTLDGSLNLKSHSLSLPK